MNEKIVALDIETENTGIDIMNDNKRILSIQILNNEFREIYYFDSTDNNLERAKQRLNSLLGDKFEFVGYNIVNFDLIMLDQFLGIKIPLSNVIEIGEMNKVNEMRQKLRKNKLTLEEVCFEAKVECYHKSLFNPLTQKFAIDPNIIERAKEEGLRLSVRKKWNVDFSRDYTLRMISRGMAILEAYNEFVRSNGSTDSLFYKYAMGDAISEYELYSKLKSN